MTFIFTAATFFIIIVLLNMLIAIMGDIYERTVERKVQNRQREMSNIMSEYIKVIPAKEDEQANEDDEEEE